MTSWPAQADRSSSQRSKRRSAPSTRVRPTSWRSPPVSTVSTTLAPSEGRRRGLGTIARKASKRAPAGTWTVHRPEPGAGRSRPSRVCCLKASRWVAKSAGSRPEVSRSRRSTPRSRSGYSTRTCCGSLGQTIDSAPSSIRQLGREVLRAGPSTQVTSSSSTRTRIPGGAKRLPTSGTAKGRATVYQERPLPVSVSTWSKSKVPSASPGARLVFGRLHSAAAASSGTASDASASSRP